MGLQCLYSENKSTVIARLICVFVFAYAKSRFSIDAVHMSVLVGPQCHKANFKAARYSYHPLLLVLHEVKPVCLENSKSDQRIYMCL